jgi:hypothetical protein
MVRLNFNVILWEAEQAGEKLDKTAKPIYYSAYRQLYDSYAIAAKAARENGHLDESDRSYYLDWLAEEYREQCAALAAMTFALLWRAIRFHLESMKNLLGKRFTPQYSPAGKSELERFVNEFQSRFGVRLEGLCHFATVREVVLARNSTLHSSDGPSKDYKEQTRNRCVGQFGELNLTPELLEMLVEELKQFIRELGAEMSRVMI